MNIQEKLLQFKSEIHKVIVGQDHILDLLFVSLIERGHVLFESVPGTGKTVLSKSIAQTISGDFKRIQFTPDVLPTDITGFNIYNPKTQNFELKKGPVNTNVLLADEINRATPRTQSALLEVMEEKQITIDGTQIKIEDPFIVLATQNPIESKQGTFQLPEAQMDRFFMKINLEYPSKDEEIEMLHLYDRSHSHEEIQPVFTLEDINKLQKERAHVTVNDTVKVYLLNIVRATRAHAMTEIGVSPRGTLHLMRAAQGYAYIQGRDYVIPDDVKYVAPYVLSHRIVLNIEGMTTTSQLSVIKDVLNQIQVPVEFGVRRDEV